MTAVNGPTISSTWASSGGAVAMNGEQVAVNRRTEAATDGVRVAADGQMAAAINGGGNSDNEVGEH